VDTGKLIRWSAWAVPAAFGLAVLSGIFVPLYTDEVGWRLQERAALDGVDKLFSLLCGPTSLARPPWWMMPARHYSAFWNVQFPSPLYTRISGILYALAWGAMLARLIVRLVPQIERRRVLTVLAFTMVTIGLGPWLLVWSRPEQPILLCLTGAILVSSRAWDRPAEQGVGAPWLRAAAILALAAIAVSYHLKAIFLFPVFLACLVASSRGKSNLAPRVIGSVLVTALTAQGAGYWIARLRCPIDQAYLHSQNLGADLLAARTIGEATAVAQQMFLNINPFVYIARSVPRPNPMSAWLAELQIDMAPALTWWLGLSFVWCLLLVFAVEAMIRQVCRARAEGLDPRVLIAAALVVSLVGWSATQVSKNDYEAILVVPMLLLVVVLGLSSRALPENVVKILRTAALGAPAAVMLSMIAVGWIYTPSLASAFHQRGYIDQQPYSTTAFGYEPVRRRLHALAAACGIDPVRSRNLVLDDVTYYGFMRSRTPDHAGGRFGIGAAEALSYDYLRRRASDGVIASCRKLPRALQSVAKRDGDLCCLAPTWNAPVTPRAK
jgi:hypothetical protein